MTRRPRRPKQRKHDNPPSTGKASGLLACPKCGTRFLATHKQHFEQHCSKCPRQVTCKKCDRKLLNLNIKEHRKSCKGKSKKTCLRCKKRLLATSMKAHEATCKNKKTCLRCKKRLLATSMKAHEATCKGAKKKKKPRRCKYCGKTTVAQSLGAHYKRCKAAPPSKRRSTDLMNTGLVYGYPLGRWSNYD